MREGPQFTEGFSARSVVWRDRHTLVCALWIWLGCSAMYLITGPGRLDMVDGAIRYDVAEALIAVGKPIVTHPWLASVRGVDGQRYAFYQPGHSLLGIPFILVGNMLGDGFRESRQFAFSLTTVPFAAGAVALLFLIYARLGISLVRATVWSMVTAFTSLLWPYAGSTFDLAIQAFCVLLGIWAGIEAIANNSIRWAILCGCAFILLATVQEVYIVLGAAILLAAPEPTLFRGALGALRLRATWVAIALMGVGACCVLAFNAYRFGSPLDTGRFAVPHPIVGNPLVGLAGLFLSPAKSIFLYSPACALALTGLFKLLRTLPRVGRPIAAAYAMQLAIVSSLACWAGEWAWGPRYLVATLPLISIGLPFALPAGSRRWLKLSVLLAGLVVQLLALSVDHQRYYVERGYKPFFWVDNSTMWRDSPVFARPGELIEILANADLAKVKALVPGPRPFSMTSAIFGPPGAELTPSYAPRWLRTFLVFVVPRPWTVWGLILPPELRPVAPLFGAAGFVVALLSFAALGLRLRRKEERMSISGIASVGDADSPAGTMEGAVANQPPQLDAIGSRGTPRSASSTASNEAKNDRK